MRVQADGGYFTKSESVAVSTDQRAIIIKNGDEINMTLATGYTGDGEDFAWIIPTPVPPKNEDIREAGERGDAAFELLQQLTAPVVSSPAPFKGKADTRSVIPPVTIHGHVVLKHYEVSILEAAAASALLDWLQANGYRVNPTAQAVLDTYIEGNWAFVAVKLNPGETRKYDNEFLPALTISYRCERLIFPLRVSAVSTTGTAVVLWKGRYEASDDLGSALDGLAKNRATGRTGLCLTRLELRTRPAAMTEDIRLAADPEPGSFSIAVQTDQALAALPQKVPGVSGAKAVSLGYYTTLIKQDVTVWGWGVNEWGTPEEEFVDRRAPKQVAGLSGVVSVADTWYTTILLKEDGTVWNALNEIGQFKPPFSTHWTEPEESPDLSDVVAIAPWLALKNDGTVWAWSPNWHGVWGFGEGSDKGWWNAPQQIRELSAVVAIASSGSHCLVSREGGTVWSWGLNSCGQLGDGGTADSAVPVQAVGLSDVVSVFAGKNRTAAIGADGSLWAWGDWLNSR